MAVKPCILQKVVHRNIEEAEDALYGSHFINGFVTGYILEHNGEISVNIIFEIEGEPLRSQRRAYVLKG